MQVSGCERGKIQPLAGVVLGSSSIAQMLDQCEGSFVALALLNASARST